MEKLDIYLELISTLNNTTILYDEIERGDDSCWEVLIEVVESLQRIIGEETKENRSLWENASKKILEVAEKKLACKEDVQRWVLLGKDILSVKLASVMCEVEALECDIAHDIINYFESTRVDPMIKAAGMYVTALLMSEKEPRYCYEKSMQAFKLYPELGSVFDNPYVYRQNHLKESYYDYCPICGSKEGTPFYCAQQLLVIKESEFFSPSKLWIKCNECGNLYAYNFPVFAMDKINGHYTASSKEEYITPRYSLKVFSNIFNTCKQYTEGTQYLEIGVGKGEMLAAALEMGYNVDAIEICKEDCEKIAHILKVKINLGDFLQFETAKKYDVIVMGDVLEHVSDPIAALKKAEKLLMPKGVLWLSTPNYNSGHSRLMRFHDAMWNQKNHFTYFSYETLIPFLTELGLQVKKYEISERYHGSMELFIQKGELD